MWQTCLLSFLMCALRLDLSPLLFFLREYVHLPNCCPPPPPPPPPPPLAPQQTKRFKFNEMWSYHQEGTGETRWIRLLKPFQNCKSYFWTFCFKQSVFKISRFLNQQVAIAQWVFEQLCYVSPSPCNGSMPIWSWRPLWGRWRHPAPPIRKVIGLIFLKRGNDNRAFPKLKSGKSFCYLKRKACIFLGNNVGKINCFFFRTL